MPEPIIPYGECQCGCGGKPKISRQNCTRGGHIRGEPRKYLPGHSPRPLLVPEPAQPFKIAGVYCRLMALAGGQYAIVDATDYAYLAQWKWRARWSHTAKSYYAMRKVVVGRKKDGKKLTRVVLMHRVILCLEFADKVLGDHTNRCTLDNRKLNLRRATRSQNRMNSGMQANNTSGHVGVYRRLRGDRCQWEVITGEGLNRHYGGAYDSKEQAIEARKIAVARYHGEYAANLAGLPSAPSRPPTES